MPAIFGEQELLELCKARRATRRASTALPLDRVWECILRWIAEQLNRCRGASIPHLCTFTWRVDGLAPTRTPSSRAGSSAGSAAGRYRPVCIFHERFLTDTGLKSRMHTAAGFRANELAKTEPLNCTRLALNFSTNLTKDEVFSGSRELVSAIFSIASAHEEAAIDLSGVGLLVVSARHASFEFAPNFLPAAEREDALLRLAEIRRMAAPSVDPMLNRHAHEEEPLALGLSGKAAATLPTAPPSPPAAARKVVGLAQSRGAAGRPPRSGAALDRENRGSSTDATTAQAQARTRTHSVRGTPSQLPPRPSTAAAPPSRGRAQPAPLVLQGLRDPSVRLALEGALDVRASAKPPPRPREQPHAPRAAPSARSASAPRRPPPLSMAEEDARVQLELEVDRYGLSPIPRLAPGEGAKHTPPVRAHARARAPAGPMAVAMACGSQ